MDELEEKLLIDPFVTDISPAAKSEVASLDVKVRDRLVSAEVSPSDTSAAVIVMVGGVVSGSVMVSNAVTGVALSILNSSTT